MRYIRRVRPLCWLLLGFFGNIIVYWNIWSWQYTAASTGLHVLFTILISASIGSNYL